MQTEQLLVHGKDNILTLTFNRPGKRNALTPDMLLALYRVLETHAGTDEYRTVILTGRGDRAFSSGYDINAIPTTVSPDLEALLQKKSPFELAVDQIVNFPYPVIAMVNGFAFGGACDLAVSCDIRIAADDIQMGDCLMWCNSKGSVTVTTGSTTGHIALASTKAIDYKKKKYVKVAESTGGKGPVCSWYRIIRVSKKGVFRVRRGCTGTYSWVRFFQAI